jgi:hypothetical protein
MRLGTEEEFQDFNRWLGQVQPHFPRGVYVILGNHDYKFLNGTEASEELIEVLASDEKRREFLAKKLPNAIVLDSESKKVTVGPNNDLTLTIYALPWNPWQSSPTYPDRITSDGSIKSDHDRVFLKWCEGVPEDQKKRWRSGEAWRYEEIPADGSIDILITHVPPLGVFDKQPVLANWGSSEALLSTLLEAKPRMHLFGHVHAQRGFWEKIDVPASNEEGGQVGGKEGSPVVTVIQGGVQYAKATNEEKKDDLMEGGEDVGIQFMANSALMSDRTVQPFAKKKIVGKPRLICGTWRAGEEGKGKWYFRGTGGGAKTSW